MPLNRLPRHAASRHADHVALALLTALLLPLYLATMYPDVVGTGDTAKFQYLGRFSEPRIRRDIRPT